MTNSNKHRLDAVSGIVTPFEIALDFLRRGWSVIPVAERSKRARVKWKEYQERLPSIEEIEAWQNHKAFAVVTGRLSNVVVLDVDPGGVESLKDRPIPITPCARTPRGGWHYYFRYPGVRVMTVTKFLPGLDMRGDGGMAVLPGPAGRYWQVSPEQAEFAELPDWLSDLLVSNKRGPASKLLCLPDSKHSNVEKNKHSNVDSASISGERLKEVVNDTGIGIRIAEHIGLPINGLAENGHTPAFCCVLPGHAESKPSASLTVHPETGGVLYHDWHGKSGHNYFALADVYASLKYGQTKRFSASELVTWQLRLFVEIGHVCPLPVSIKPLPYPVSESTMNVYEGFKLLLGCRWLHTHGEPTPFSRKFISAWCGISESAAQQARQILHTELKIIRIVSTYGHLRLWLPWTNSRE